MAARPPSSTSCPPSFAVSRVLVRPISQKYGGKYYAVPRSLDDLRRELAIPPEMKILNEDLGELKDVSLLRDGDILYCGAVESSVPPIHVNKEQSVSDAIRNIFGSGQQESVVSYGGTIDSALANVIHVMRSYEQNGPISRRQRASQRSRLPYSRPPGRPMVTPQKKRRVVEALFYNTVVERSKDEPWCYKSFREIWEGNIEYSDQSSESEILNSICDAYNSSSPMNKPNVAPLKQEQIRFVHRKNGKVTTRQSAVYDGPGISCNYRQGCIYVELLMSTTCTTTIHDGNVGSARTATQSSLCSYFESSTATAGPSTSRPEFHQNVIINDIEWPAPNNMHGGANITQSSSSHESEQVETLKEMFPDKNSEQIEQALRQTQSDVRANNCDDDDDCSDHDQWLWNAPLAASAIVKTEDAIMSLKKFTAGAVKPFACDVNVQVDRNTDLLKQMLRKYKNPGFDVTRPLCVEFVNELGVDAGGLTREFFHLLMERLKNQLEGGSLNLFEGQIGHLVPIHDYDVLSGGLFVQAGRMILHSILNECNGVPGLSPAVVSYLTSGKRDAAVAHITVDDIPDPDLKEKLTELLSCGDQLLINFTDPDSPKDITDLLMTAGFPHFTITSKRRHIAYECILLYEVITKRIPALDDLRRGLGEVKVAGVTLLSLLERYPKLQQKVFPMDMGIIDERTTRKHIQYDETTEPLCQRAQTFFAQYIDDLFRDDAKGQEGLCDLLQFWTGYPSLPMDPTTMIHVKYLANSVTKVLAEANTCPLILLIPVVHEEYSIFKDYLNKSIAFGKFGFERM